MGWSLPRLECHDRCGIRPPIRRADRSGSRREPDSVEISAASLKEISAHEADRTITLPSGIGLDFGGVAKGWAAHQAMERLQVEGPALVDAAGDIAISGPRAGWKSLADRGSRSIS